MITAEYARTMARYNAWQNISLYNAADTLPDIERRQQRGAFFGSIHETLCHLLWGDQMWMSRFTDTPPPAAGSIGESRDMISDWVELRQQRKAFDQTILNWSESLKDEDLEGNLSWYSGAAQKDVTKPFGFLITHLFNHQTHHRGQVHAMLTSAGAKPDDTDLFYLSD